MIDIIDINENEELSALFKEITKDLSNDEILQHLIHITLLVVGIICKDDKKMIASMRLACKVINEVNKIKKDIEDKEEKPC
ncbi:MAG: hypothetical protein LBV53_02965 [Mycoplasmataceae bacterium]|jgi:hypothetical protein|nr:hypothetical protein [Mycoplasmataceae bacterium]